MSKMSAFDKIISIVLIFLSRSNPSFLLKPKPKPNFDCSACIENRSGYMGGMLERSISSASIVARRTDVEG